jgi:hypothetical protein
MPPSSSGLLKSDPLLSALLKLLAIVVQPDRAQPLDLKRIISRKEARALGLDDSIIRALLEANQVEERQTERAAKPISARRNDEAVQGLGLALTDEGLARIAARVGEIGLGWEAKRAKRRRPRLVRLASGGGELHFGGELLLRLRHDSQWARRVLEAFEHARWSQGIANPLGPEAKKTLQGALGRLNRGQDPLRVRFHSYNGGIYWDIVG